MTQTSIPIPIRTVLVVGATGSIGRLAVAESIRQGHETRALVRDAKQTTTFDAPVSTVVADLTDAETLADAVDGVDAVVFTHGTHGGAAGMEAVDYGAVRNVLIALGDRPARIAVMTSIGVTNREGYNRTNEAHDWKRRGERLVRASGRAYTVVRPGWFDHNDADEHHLVFLQGDTRRAGNSSDGVISRAQIAHVLVSSLGLPEANRKTLELVAERGESQADLAPLFDALDADPDGSIDGVRDEDNQPLDDEPDRVLADLETISGH